MKRLRDRQLTASRVLLVVLGLLLVALAATGLLLASEGVDRISDPLTASDPVLNENGRRFIDDHQLPLQLGALGLGVLLVVVGIWWLRIQIPPVRHQEDHRFDNEDPSHTGNNVVVGGALAEALTSDLERHPAIQSARVEFRTDSDLVRLRLDVDETVPIDTVLDDVVEPAVHRLATVAELERVPQIHADVRPVDVSLPRVA